MWKGINGDIAGTLDSNYHRGCANRGGESEMEFSIQRTDEYKLSQKASTLSARDYKSATDLVVRERERERERWQIVLFAA